jgi:cobyrinic acid a,c-diamide synthase
MGVILNGAAGPLHLDLLRHAIAPVGVPVLGRFPRLPEFGLHERHLGLVTAGEKTWSGEQANLLAATAEKYIDLDPLLAACELYETGLFPPKKFAARKSANLARPQYRVRVGIARDRAFSFYYESSLDALRKADAELVPGSPLVDAALPPSLDGLYLGGGYPEVFAEQLSHNDSFLKSVREFTATGRPVYGECGGLMYLAQELRTLDGRRHPMASVLPLAVEMLDHSEGFGYTEVEILDDCLVGQQGTRLRGHSFHYSRASVTQDLDLRYRTTRTLAGDEKVEGYCRGNVLASYIHLSFASHPEVAATFTRHCREASAVAA